jgi:hypothetical protein
VIGRVFGGLAFAALLAALGWFLWAQGTERVVRDWLAARAAEGWLVNREALDVTGFPSEFRTVLTGLELADPDTGWVWTLPRLELVQPVFDPGHVRAVWPPEQSLASPYERLAISSAAMTSELELRPADLYALDLSDTRLAEVTVESSAGWRMALAEGHLTMARREGTEAAYAVSFAARDLAPPARARAQLDPARVLPETIAVLGYDAVMEFDRSWDLRAIEERRPQPVRIDLRELQAVWGGLLLRAAGELVVSETGVPEGEIAVRAENWRDMVDLAVNGGVIPEQMRGTVEGLLGVVAGLSGDPEVIDATLGFSGGRMFLGPLPLGPAPRLILR